jgi:hypothetical protein
MRFLISPSQIAYFQQNGLIEFHHLLGKEEARRGFISCDQLLQKRLGIDPADLVYTPQDNLTAVSVDAFREDAFLQKIATRRPFAEIVYQLTKKNPLRLAFDCVIYTNEKENPLFIEKRAIQDYFCVQGLAAVLLLRLSFLKQERTYEDPVPKEIGNGIFIKPETLIDFSSLFSLPSQMFYLIGYSESKSLFTPNLQAPHLRRFKELGYSFGDTLKEPHHPLVYK